jgi:hypothetical protein
MIKFSQQKMSGALSRQSKQDLVSIHRSHPGISHFKSSIKLQMHNVLKLTNLEKLING